MISINRLELHNFLSHASTTLNLDEYEGLVLIEGKNASGHYSSNGSGKSTLLEGIVYALTGNTLRGLAVNDVVNRNAKKNTHVSLDFLKGGTHYEVSRYRKDDKYADSLFLSKEDEDISKRVNKETQKLLDDTLGISYKILVSTMLLGEGLSSRFTQLSDPDKKSLIESTLNLDYDLSKIRDKANAQLKKLNMEIARLEGEISVLQSYEDQGIDLLQDSIHDDTAVIVHCEEESAKLKSEIERLQLEIDAIHPKIQLINNTITQYNNYARQYTELMQSNAHYQEERDRVISGSNPVCSMCHQLLQSVESRDAVISSYQSKIDENLKNMNYLDEQIAKLPDINILNAKAESLEKDYSEKSLRVRSLSTQYNECQVKMAEAKKDIEISKGMIENAEENHKQLLAKIDEKGKLSQEKERYDYFYKLFSPTGIIVNILSDAIEYINNRLATYSEILLEKDYRINFLKGKISLVDNKGSTYQSLSNGEKRRLDISIQFALHDYVHTYCGMKMDCCFIDEILDTLDDVGVENIFDVLRLKLEYCKLRSIYVITHNDALKSKFDQIITVRKDKSGNSYLVVK